ncbi:MAG: TIGR03067 domain-containing protein [Blastocatellia bacterium]
MKRLMLVALAIGIACVVSSLAQDAKNDVEQLQGQWTALGAFDDDGKIKEVTEDDPGHFTFEFNADKLTSQLKKGKIQGVYKLDSSRKPKEIDVVRRVGGEERTFKGIYFVEKDRLKVCLAGTGNERPKDFKTGKGIEFAVELKRVKK